MRLESGHRELILIIGSLNDKITIDSFIIKKQMVL